MEASGEIQECSRSQPAAPWFSDLWNQRLIGIDCWDTETTAGTVCLSQLIFHRYQRSILISRHWSSLKEPKLDCAALSCQSLNGFCLRRKGLTKGWLMKTPHCFIPSEVICWRSAAPPWWLQTLCRFFWMKKLSKHLFTYFMQNQEGCL